MDNIYYILVANGGSLAKSIKNANKLAVNKHSNYSTGISEFFKRYITK